MPRLKLYGANNDPNFTNSIFTAGNSSVSIVVAVVKRGSRKQTWHVEKNDKGRQNEENMGEQNNGEGDLVDGAQPQSPDASLGQFGRKDFDLKEKIEGGTRKSDLDLMAFVLNICPLPAKYPHFVFTFNAL